jgi:alkanesulfonate monooxygenase
MSLSRTLRFHWRLLEGGEASAGPLGGLRHDALKGLPDLEVQARFCRDAERAGIDSLLVDVGFAKADPMILAVALARLTTSIHFMVACRPGLMSPTLFVQQVNTFSALCGGRIRLNVVSGQSLRELRSYGDSLDHDARYARMCEFLEICLAFWHQDGPIEYAGDFYQIRDGRLQTPFVSDWSRAPEIFVGGNSAASREVAVRRGDCWVRFPLPLDELAREIRPVLDAGKQAGLRMAVITRPTREEALGAARSLVEMNAGSETRSRGLRAFVEASDSESIRSLDELARDEWLAPCLWTGAVPFFGITCVCLLGSYDEVAEQLISLGKIGISQFIFSGWPKWDEMVRFGREVIPRVRDLEDYTHCANEESTDDRIVDPHGHARIAEASGSH